MPIPLLIGAAVAAVGVGGAVAAKLYKDSEDEKLKSREEAKAREAKARRNRERKKQTLAREKAKFLREQQKLASENFIEKFSLKGLSAQTLIDLSSKSTPVVKSICMNCYRGSPEQSNKHKKLEQLKKELSELEGLEKKLQEYS